jgi:hypothetical protein
MQKLPLGGALPELMSSVPSACQVTNPLSISAPSGGPPEGLPFAVNVNFHNPVIGARSSSKSVRMNSSAPS